MTDAPTLDETVTRIETDLAKGWRARDKDVRALLAHVQALLDERKRVLKVIKAAPFSRI